MQSKVLVPAIGLRSGGLLGESVNLAAAFDEILHHDASDWSAKTFTIKGPIGEKLANMFADTAFSSRRCQLTTARA